MKIKTAKEIVNEVKLNEINWKMNIQVLLIENKHPGIGMAMMNVLEEFNRKSKYTNRHSKSSCLKDEEYYIHNDFKFYTEDRLIQLYQEDYIKYLQEKLKRRLNERRD